MAKQNKSIVKYEPTDAMAILPTFNDGLSRLAEILSLENLTPATLAATMKVLRDVKKVISDDRSGLETAAKAKIVQLLRGLPAKAGTKGSREMLIDGWRIPMKPYRTGTDPKKLEALLRAKDQDPKKFMNMKISFEVSDDTGKLAALAKVVSEDEMKTCEYNESWTVETPEPV